MIKALEKLFLTNAMEYKTLRHGLNKSIISSKTLCQALIQTKARKDYGRLMIGLIENLRPVAESCPLVVPSKYHQTLARLITFLV